MPAIFGVKSGDLLSVTCYYCTGGRKSTGLCTCIKKRILNNGNLAVKVPKTINYCTKCSISGLHAKMKIFLYAGTRTLMEIDG